MDDIKKIAVICGGSSPEREISLQSGNGVGNALIELGISNINNRFSRS